VDPGFLFIDLAVLLTVIDVPYVAQVGILLMGYRDKDGNKSSPPCNDTDQVPIVAGALMMFSAPRRDPHRAPPAPCDPTTVDFRLCGSGDTVPCHSSSGVHPPSRQ